MISFKGASGVAGMRPESGSRGPSSLPSRHALTVRINSAQRSDLNVTALPITIDTGLGFPREYQRCGSADEQDQADDQTQEWFFQLHVN